jgi:hypothetical protein
MLVPAPCKGPFGGQCYSLHLPAGKKGGQLEVHMIHTKPFPRLPLVNTLPAQRTRHIRNIKPN